MTEQRIWVSVGPKKDILNIRLTGLHQNASLYVSVIDTKGKIMCYQEVSLKGDEVQVLCKNWISGTYIVMVTVEGENAVYKQKINIGK